MRAKNATMSVVLTSVCIVMCGCQSDEKKALNEIVSRLPISLRERETALTFDSNLGYYARYTVTAMTAEELARWFDDNGFDIHKQDVNEYHGFDSEGSRILISNRNALVLQIWYFVDS